MATKYAAHLKPDADQNPFDSPGPSVNSVEDTESGNTSGQDEFHLERYSEGLKWDEGRRTPRHPKPARQPSKRAREPSPRKRPRPGLNIITDFSKPVGRAFTDGAVLDKVRTQRPEVGQRPLLTARSQTVEHVRPEPHHPQSEGAGFVNLNDLVDLRKKEKRQKSPQKSNKKSKVPGLWSDDKQKPSPAYSAKDPDYNTSIRPLRTGESYRRQDEAAQDSHLDGPKQEEASSSNSSIVIGISVPGNDVDSHKPQPEASSALTMHTPFTPAIVVTPADATWNKHLDAHDGARRRRPASSVYSQATPYISQFSTSTDAPAVPSLPLGFTKNNRDADSTPPRRSVDSWESIVARRRRAYSAGTIFDEDDTDFGTRPRSSSAESKVAILPSSVGSARPQSKGWWNVMLSPMLSRAGTLMSRKSPPMKHPIPPMPTLSTDWEKTDQPDRLDEKSVPIGDSEDFKQEVGLNIKRASTWSQWSSWEKGREQSKDHSKITEQAEVDSSKGHKGQDSSATVQFMMKPSPVAEGLAAEYYRACAIDLRSTTPYFRCQNHSCAQKLPKLASVSVATDNRRNVEPITDPFTDGCIEPQSKPTNLLATNDKHLRSDSGSTVIEDEPAEVSPVVRKAKMAPTLNAQETSASGPAGTNKSDEKDKAGAKPEAGLQSEKFVTPPKYSPPRPGITRFPRHIATIGPESRIPPVSPGPMSPEAQRAMASQGAIPMAEVHSVPRTPPAPTFINNYTIYPGLPSRPNVEPVSLADIDRPSKIQQKAEAKRRNMEKEDAAAKKVGGLWRGRGCVPKNGCFGRGGPEGRNRRRWYIVIAVGLFLVVIASIVLATQLTRRGDATPVQSQWLNLTGFPPMPTGVSTIARPDPAVENSGCVNLDTLWSCAVPKEDQASIAPNDPDQPNFRIEITFRNGTLPANDTTALPNSAVSKRSIAPKLDDLQRRQNDPFTNALFAPTPAAPANAEQMFLGNTTDDITSPFNGEATPFFITFIPSSPVLPSAFNTTSTRLRTRQTSNSSNTVTSDVPAPDIGTDGTAAPANLLPNDPLPYSQPIRLYNRGQSTEHYGFYTYFDRAIFLTNTTLVAGGQSGPSEDQNGGSTKAEANWQCTFSQTRFLVRIWTNAGFGGTLINGGPTVFPSVSGDNPTATTANSTATDFTPPGSFPYPISVTLDRHGGDMNKKGAYCYKMDPNGDGTIVVDETSPVVVPEDRGAGGVEVNAAPSKLNLPGGGSADGTFDPNAGGIDGGNGGCSCEWRNWLGNVVGNV